MSASGWTSGRRKKSGFENESKLTSNVQGASEIEGKAAVAAALLAMGRGEPLPSIPENIPADILYLLQLTAVTADKMELQQASLERSAIHVSRLLEATGEGVYVQDNEGMVTFINSAGLRLLGWLRENVIGKNAHALFHTGKTECVIEKVASNALVEVLQTTFKTSQGRNLPVDITASPVVHDGVFAETICTFSDATLRIKKEKLLRTSLEAQTRALEKERDLNKQKVDFISTVSHELRTPLTSVLGYLELINEGLCGNFDPEVGEKLAIIERNSKRLLSQVQDLLLVSRIESGVIKADMVLVDLAKIIKETVDVVRPQAEAKKLLFDLSVPSVIPQVRGDARQLDQVLLNLLSNAVKFTSAGGEIGVTVTVHARHVEVEIADTGMGIPQQEQGRLFEKFFRSSISQQQAVQGTGLGLAIVKAIVEEHGGKIAVVSQEGIGTTIAFSLPLPR